MKTTNLAAALCCLVFILNLPAQTLTQSDFLKADGTVLRNNSGTGNIVNLRGTNLGSWLSMEYWMGPLGTGSLNRSQWTASASSTYPGTSLQSVFDRSASTRWSSGAAQSPGQYFMVDLGKKNIFNRISFEASAFTGDYPRAYKIEVSDSGTVWETVTTGTGSGENIFIQLPNIYYSRYVKITQTGTAPANFWSISEFNLYMEDDFSVRNSLYDRFGTVQADALLDSFQNSWITAADLDSIKNMGMNMVRVPFYWMEIMNNDGTIKTDGFKQLDWVVAQCRTRGIYVILDLHGAPGGINGFITSGQAHANNYWTDAASQQMTVNLWKAVAQRYKTNPAVAAYDLLNEPLSSSQTLYPISAFYNSLYQQVRAVDPDHIISIGAFPGFSFVEPPSAYGWTNVLYQVHNYNEDKQNYGSQSSFIDAVLLDIANHQHNWNIPVLAGEFNFWNFPELWQKYIRGLNALNVSWSNWAYKVKRTDAPVENWGYYQGNSNPAPDIHYDDPSVIESKWSAFQTSGFTPNIVLINLVTPLTSSVPAVPPIGKTIWLKGSNDKYVSSEGNDNPMTCIRNSYAGWELFEAVDAGNGKIALKGSGGRFVSSQGGTSPMMCNKTAIGPNETFTFISIGDSKAAFRAGNGKYICSMNGSGPMMCDKNEIASWESFTWGENNAAARTLKKAGGEFKKNEDTNILYPNPCSDMIQIQTGSSEYDAEIFDSRGALIKKIEKGRNSEKINIENLPSGIYTAVIYSDDTITKKKLIIN